MAKVYLKKGANPKAVAKRLKKAGLIMTRQLEDGSYVVFKKRKRYEKDNLEAL